MYPPPYVEPLPVVTPNEPLPSRVILPWPLNVILLGENVCPCGLVLPHASACAFSLDPEAV